MGDVRDVRDYGESILLQKHAIINEKKNHIVHKHGI